MSEEQAVTATTIEGVGLLAIPASELYEHPKNPRRHFSEKGLAEMSASIAAGGIRVPFTVWPRLDEAPGYWILAGARRFRGGKAAGLQMFPCVVRDCGEQEAL